MYAIMILILAMSFVHVFVHSQVGQGYPHDPPKVKCETMVYHPNIDLEGNVCLNILRYVSYTLPSVSAYRI